MSLLKRYSLAAAPREGGQIKRDVRVFVVHTRSRLNIGNFDASAAARLCSRKYNKARQLASSYVHAERFLLFSIAWGIQNQIRKRKKKNKIHHLGPDDHEHMMLGPICRSSVPPTLKDAMFNILRCYPTPPPPPQMQPSRPSEFLVLFWNTRRRDVI